MSKKLVVCNSCGYSDEIGRKNNLPDYWVSVDDEWFCCQGCVDDHLVECAYNDMDLLRFMKRAKP